MFDPVIKFFSDHWPKLTVALIVIGLCIWATVYITKKIMEILARIAGAHTKCDNANTYIVDVETRIDNSVMPKLDTMSTTLGALNTSIHGLIIYLKSKDGNMDTSLFRSQSPTQLTDLGLKILNESGGKIYIDENLDVLISEIDKQDVKTALDVQSSAPVVVINGSSDEKFNSIKNFIFNNPQYKPNPSSESYVVMDLNVMSTIMGIYLRDKYLEKHPELTS